jgi:hypothetical protein
MDNKLSKNDVARDSFYRKWAKRLSPKSQRVAEVATGLRQDRGEGVGNPATPNVDMNPLIVANLPQKGTCVEPCPQPAAEQPISANPSHITALGGEFSEPSIQNCDRPVAAVKTAELEAVVYARAVNPYILLIRLPDGTHGKVRVRPEDRAKFGVGQRIYVISSKNGDNYEITGAYNRWGKRCR